jgi:cell division protein FtsI/penicillin-binding protein 2
MSKPIIALSNHRIRLLAWFVVIMFAVFVVRLFWLQVIDHDKFVSLANQEQLKRLVIPAKRGEIYMMDGDKLAKVVLNETVYTVFVDPQIIDKPEKVIEALKEIAGGNLRENYDDFVGKKDLRYWVVANKVTRTQAELLKKRKLGGIGFQAVTQRVYPEQQLASQTLGFVNAEGKGSYGVEGYLDKQLTGADGLLQSVTDISSVPLTIGKNNINRPARDGDDIALTIDRNIQSYTEQALAQGLKDAGATNASAIVMDPRSGKVLAMASLPTYNPAKYWEVKDANDFKNVATMVPYEAGSVFKPFTLGIGIDKGVVEPSSTFYNTDSIRVEDRVIKNALKGYTGQITMQDALNYSLNTGMVTVAERLGGTSGTISKPARQVIYDYFHDRYRLGEITGIEVSGEATGRIISPDQQEGNAVRYSNMVFGQGLNVTMVQAAAGFGALINGGTYYQPTVIAGTIDDEGNLVKSKPKQAYGSVVSSATSRKVKDMAHKARRVFTKDDKSGYYIGGKTGTSQTIENGKYTFDQTTASYLGYGGTKNESEYVIMVQISGKGLELEGNIHAEPIFTNISNWLVDYLRIAPEK